MNTLIYHSKNAHIQWNSDILRSLGSKSPAIARYPGHDYRAFPPENLKKKSLKIGQIIKKLEPKMWGNVIRSGIVIGRTPLTAYVTWEDVITPVRWGVIIIAVRSANVRDDYSFGYNFLNICPIFKLFFFKFSERLALSVLSVGVHKGTASYPISRDKRPRDNRVSLYVVSYWCSIHFICCLAPIRCYRLLRCDGTVYDLDH